MSDNKRNIDDEYESFMAYLRGEAPAPDAEETTAAKPEPDPSELGIDDEDDAFNVIDAVKEFERFGEARRNRARAAGQPAENEAAGAPQPGELRQKSDYVLAGQDAAEPVAQRGGSADGVEKKKSAGSGLFDGLDEFDAESAAKDAVKETVERGAERREAPADREKKPAESGLFAGLDEFDAAHGGLEADGEPVREYRPAHRQPGFGSEKTGAIVPPDEKEEYIKAWRSIPEEAPTRSKRQTASSGADADRGNFIDRRRSRRKRTRFKLLKSLAWLMACLVVAVALSIFLIQSCGDIFGYDSGGEDTPFVITRSDDLSSVAERLSDSGIIEQKLTFKFYAKFKKATDGFTPGTYNLNPDMSYDEILALTRRTATEEKKVVKITFREGLTIYEIADLLDENGVCDKKEFLDTLQNEELGFAFIDDIPRDSRRFSRLEGYLFPDTYDFYVGEKTSSVAKKFLNNFNNKITASMYKKMEEQGITLDQLVTLASIVQKEAGRAKEMYRVSSVFRNRLDSNGAFPLLQSDTTTNYINDYIKPNGGSQEMIDAYDTYSTSGLPVGPICCPGINALRAALDPAETPYYFFLSDEKGTYYYAETFAGHRNNAAKAASVGKGEVHGIGMDTGKTGE